MTFVNAINTSALFIKPKRSCATETCVMGTAGGKLQTQKCHDGLIVAVRSIKGLWSIKTHYRDIKEVWDVLVNQRQAHRAADECVLCVRGLDVSALWENSLVFRGQGHDARDALAWCSFTTFRPDFECIIPHASNMLRWNGPYMRDSFIWTWKWWIALRDLGTLRVQWH